MATIKQRLNNTNGWQRLFVFICLIFAVITYFSSQIPEVKPNIEPFLSQLSPKYSESLKNRDFATFFLMEFDKFKMPDGEILTIEKGVATQEQVEQSYKKAVNKADSEYWSVQRLAYIDGYKNYLIAMACLYLVGWLVAWIRKGFKKK